VAFPEWIVANTTGQTFGTNTYGRLLRFEDLRAGAGLYDMGIDASSSFFITTKNAATGGVPFAEALTVTATGNVGIGVTSPNNELGVHGNIAATGTIMGGVGAPDLAENIAGTPEVEAADVVTVDPRGGERVVRTDHAYQSSVLGVISTRPGLLTNAQASDVDNTVARDPAQRPIALAGRVPVKVTLTGGPIKPGDLLTTSNVPGHAMRAVEPWRGGIVGVAMTSFSGKNEAGQEVASGKVLVFIQVRAAPSVDVLSVTKLQDRLADAESKLAKLSGLESRLRDLEAHMAASAGQHPAKLSLR
jgi:hypothetical protein